MATENIDIIVRQRGAQVVKRQVAGIGTSASRAARGVGGLQSILNAAFGAVAIREAGRALDSYTNIQNRLRLISDGTEGLANLNELVFAQAQRTRTSYEAQASLVSRISRAAESLGASQAEVLKVSEGVAQSFAISGSSMQETTAASIQLGQALASGTLRGDELRSILENNVRLSRAIADGMGISVDQMRQLGAEGALTSREVFEAILKNTGKLESEFATLGPTLAQGFTTAQNAIIQVLGDLDIAGSLGEQFQSVGEALARLRPEITELVGEARLFTQSVFLTLEEFFLRVNFALNIVNGTLNEIGQDIAELRDDSGLFDAAVEQAGELAENFNELPLVVRALLGPVSALADGVERVADATEDADKLTKDQLANTEELAGLEAALAELEERRNESLFRGSEELRNQVQAMRDLIANAKAAEDGAGGGGVGPVVSEEDEKAALKFLEAAKSDIEKIQEQIVEVQRLTALGLLGSEDQSQRVLEQLSGELEEATAAIDGTTEAMERARDIAGSVETEVERITKQLEEARELAQAGFFEGIADDAEVLKRLEEDLEEAKEKAKEAASEVSEFAKEAARGIQSELADFLFDPFQEGLDGMLRGMLDVLRRMAAEAAAAQILEGIFPGGIQGGIGGVLGSIGGFIGGNAAGGDQPAGQPQIVGEQGPELFVPNQNGRVLSSNDSEGALAGAGGSTIINAVDNESIANAMIGAMSSGAGQKEVLNTIQVLADPIRRILGVGVT